MKRIRKGLGLRLGLLVVLCLAAACGGNPVPVLPPTAAGLGSCGAVGGGAPLLPNGQPYVANLQPLSSPGSDSNSLQLYLSYYNGAGDADDYQQMIVGTGTFNFPDISLLFPGTTGQTAFCVSSMAPQSGTIQPGEFMPDHSVQLVLDGYAQMPVMATPGLGQTMIEVAIGTQGPDSAYLTQGSIQGAVQVTLGVGSPGAAVLLYNAN